MSIKGQNKRSKAATRARDAQEDKIDGLASIVRFLQKYGVPFSLWAMPIRQYAVTNQLPVYGEVFPQQLVSFTTPEVAAFYRQYHREPWDRVETDHADDYGEWKRFCRQYDAGKFWHGRNNGVILRAGDVEKFPPDRIQLSHRTWRRSSRRKLADSRASNR